MIRFTPLAVLAALLVSATDLTADDANPAADELFQTLDANADGILTGDEIGEDQKKAFTRLLRVGDADNDGKLTRQEYSEGLRPQPKVDSTKSEAKKERPDQPTKPAGDNQPKVNVDRLFERIDANRDGKIALDEVPEPLKERLQPIFDRLSKEELTRADFEKVQRVKAGTPGQGVRPAGDQLPLFKLLDADDNGTISEEELSLLTRKFSKIDRDGDGQLTPRELIGFVGKKAAKDKPAVTDTPASADKPAAADKPSSDDQPAAETNDGKKKSKKKKPEQPEST